VGERVITGGLLSAHPLTITRIARVNRKTNRGPGILLSIVPDIIGTKIWVQGHERIAGATDLFLLLPGRV
jgi:hypothetical protein